jgi:hypothetical protein
MEFNNVNKTNNYLSPQIIEHKQPTTYAWIKSIQNCNSWYLLFIKFLLHFSL